MDSDIKKPRIRVMGENGMEEVDYDSIPDPDPVAFQMMHYFAPVKVSARAINMASKIIPNHYAAEHGGLHALLQKRAASDRSGVFGKIKYIFDFDKDGPVLVTIGLI